MKQQRAAGLAKRQILKFIENDEAICDLPASLSGGKPRWLVLYDAPGADRKDGEHTVFGDLLHHG